MPRPAELRDFTRTHRLPFTPGNRVVLFEDGATGLAAMLAAIETARSHVHLETYIFRDDRVGRRFLETLEAKARDGVEVRLLIDALGSWTLDDAAIAPLRAAGGEVVWFNPVGWIRSRLGARRRDHRKLLVVDGGTAFCGGLNIGNEYDRGSDSGPLEWRDAHVCIQGPAVLDLQAAFLESWFRGDGPGLAWRRYLAQAPEPMGDVRCAVLPDGPFFSHRRTRDLVLSALNGSTQSARFETPYFSPGRRVLEALAGASERGVDVSLVLAGRTDHPVLYRATRAMLPRLLERGVSVHEYTRSMLHAKVAVFDERWAILGTSNLDRQSLEHSYEINLVFEGDEIARQLAAHIQHNATLSLPLDRERLLARPRVERALDRAASLLLRLL